jgi:acyl CoA:acetate/3-ketoacid CoA transferase beta subunit
LPRELVDARSRRRPGPGEVVVRLPDRSREARRKEDCAYKIVNVCTLPCAGRKIVRRIITGLAVIDVTPEGLRFGEAPRGAIPEEVQDEGDPTTNP